MIGPPYPVLNGSPVVYSGPRWIAALENSLVVAGFPSWAGNSGNVGLPEGADHRLTDWSRLMLYCRDHRVRLRALTLYVPGLGDGFFRAPEGRGAYGYAEHIERLSHQAPREGYSDCVALSMYYPERIDGKLRLKEERVYATGLYERYVHVRWLPCVIGEPEAEPADKDRGEPLAG